MIIGLLSLVFIAGCFRQPDVTTTSTTSTVPTTSIATTSIIVNATNNINCDPRAIRKNLVTGQEYCSKVIERALNDNEVYDDPLTTTTSTSSSTTTTSIINNQTNNTED